MEARVLFLTQTMSLGFGVAVVVHNLALALEGLGVAVEVGCIEKDDSLKAGYPVHMLKASVIDVDALVSNRKIDYVIAHTSPFFELLPHIRSRCKRWVWEHGDPTPELFPFDGDERKRIADGKRHLVYPAVDQVVAISRFVRSDIGWPDSKIIYNGSDHISPVTRSRKSDGRIRVGTLMRLGPGEAFYKGNQLYLSLVQDLSSSGLPIDFHLMGRGSSGDASIFEYQNVTVHLNASDEHRAQYLADLDVFVSMSLWEGFNLPLLEASISGTVAFALDTGAHPEVTPYIFSNVSEMSAFIKSLASRDSGCLNIISERARNFVVNEFTWEKAAIAVVDLLYDS